MDSEINEMFSGIYTKYDFMNHVLSLNFDKGWREEAAKEALAGRKRCTILDAATGTGDLAIELSRLASKRGIEVKIIGSDINKGMLTVAKRKISRTDLNEIKLEVEDALRIGRRKEKFDIVTTGFSLRSFRFSRNGRSNLRRFVSGSYKILKKGGKAVFLEMAMPDDKLQAVFFNAYKLPMGIVGRIGNPKAYPWLISTISRFDKTELLEDMREAGFSKIRLRSLRSGIAFLAIAEKAQ